MKKKIFTMSYDDCVLQDRRLIPMLNSFGIKATFNLNSGWFGQKDRLDREDIKCDHSHVSAAEVRELYAGHEIASHSVTHPSLVGLDDERLKHEILDDVKTLSELAGYPVKGLAYPGGCCDRATAEKLGALGIKYARTIRSTYTFAAPDYPLLWDPTCHHFDEKLSELTEKFLSAESGLFYVWGHSYEFDVGNGWDNIRRFLEKISGHKDTLYLTNSEALLEIERADNY